MYGMSRADLLVHTLLSYINSKLNENDFPTPDMMARPKIVNHCVNRKKKCHA